MTDRSGPTRSQVEVFQRLMAKPAETMVRYPGGFWITASQLGAGARRTGSWYVPTTTVMTMFRRGWLRRIGPAGTPEWKDTFELTDAGRKLWVALDLGLPPPDADGPLAPTLDRPMLPGRQR